MGQEIVYCCQCQEQIRTADFAKGGALKLGDRACCVKCGPKFLATLTPQEQEKFFKEAAKLKASSQGPPTPRPGVAHSTVRRAVSSPGTRRVAPAVWIGAGVLLAVVVALGAVLGGSRPAGSPAATAKEPPPPVPKRIEAPAPPKEAPPRPLSPEERRQQEAARKLEDIKAAEARFAPDEIRRRYAEFAKEYADTPQGRTIAGWIASTEIKPEEPKAAEVPKPEIPKPPPVPPVAKPPEPAPPDPVVKAPASERPAAPDAAKLRDAEAAARKAFNLEQARTSKDKADLARTLLQAAATSGAKDAELYVLLRLARDLAAQGLDAKTAIEAIEARAAAFDVDVLAEKVDLFAKTPPKSPELTGWAEAALDVARQASEADDYEPAVKLAARAEALARSANDKALQDVAKERGKEFADLKRLSDGLKIHFKTLETAPNDPAANTAVGKFVSLVKGDWNRGLPMLAKASDPAWKNLAEQELGNPKEAPVQAALGEAWAAQAEKETPTYRAAARERAWEWLGRAIPDLTGLAKVSAERKLASLGPPAAAKSRPFLELGAGVRVDLVPVKPGTFIMGTKEAQVGWAFDAKPEHKVTITKGYFLGKYEVTRGQFAAFVKATGLKTEAEGEAKVLGRRKDGSHGLIAGATWSDPVQFTQTDDHPVTGVSWNDAKAFCDWAAKRTGRGVRLPTEAEWEYACRAGTKTKWGFGENEGASGEHVWDSANSGWQTQPVGRKKPNPWGFHDMNGNVWEWVHDWSARYTAEDSTDPAGPAGGSDRSVRGGGWATPGADCHSSIRTSHPPASRHLELGFRVAVQGP